MPAQTVVMGMVTLVEIDPCAAVLDVKAEPLPRGASAVQVGGTGMAVKTSATFFTLDALAYVRH